MEKKISSLVLMLMSGMSFVAAEGYVAIEKTTADTKGTVNGYTWVDMGLSVRWATMNVGAQKPEDHGTYVAWGETKDKLYYDWSTYQHVKGGNVNGKDASKSASDDNSTSAQNAGRLNISMGPDLSGGAKTSIEDVNASEIAYWGGAWAMPTQSDWEELSSHCTKEWTTVNGVKGYKLTAANGKSIFLPAAGYSSNKRNSVGSNGCYWSSTLAQSNTLAHYLHFGEKNFDASDNYSSCCYGLSIRLVIPGAGDTNGHTGVDLGLPSGKLWATCNVGARNPEEGGSLIAWGETEVKSVYSWGTYKYKTINTDWQNIDKYQKADNKRSGIWYDDQKRFVGDNKTTVELNDDAAAANWGKEWRMPTQEEWEELENKRNCTWTWKEVNGVKGYEVVSKRTGNSIFLPAAGYRKNGSVYGNETDGYYWASELGESDTSHACFLYFKDDYHTSTGYNSRCYGHLVRPVCPSAE